jgi:uncharacterized protein YndB with AHSA1/START domain
MSDSQPVSVSRRIDAPQGTVFALLTDPAMHPMFDGSTMVRRALSTSRITGVGDVFAMAMENGEMGPYETVNHVVAFERDRRIAWEPMLSKASRPEDQEGIGERGNVVWGFELEAVDPSTTDVTETYDCSRSPDWLRKAVRGGDRWVDTMTISLEKLADLAAPSRANATR